MPLWQGGALRDCPSRSQGPDCFNHAGLWCPTWPFVHGTYLGEHLALQASPEVGRKTASHWARLFSRWELQRCSPSGAGRGSPRQAFSPAPRGLSPADGFPRCVCLWEEESLPGKSFQISSVSVLSRWTRRNTQPHRAALLTAARRWGRPGVRPGRAGKLSVGGISFLLGKEILTPRQCGVEEP